MGVYSMDTETKRSRRGSFYVVCLLFVSLVLAVVGTDPAVAQNEAPVPDEPISPLSADGCTGFGTGVQTCIHIRGSGLRIDDVWTDFQASPTWKCQTRLRIAFFDSNNSAYRIITGPLYSGCRTNGIFDPNITLPYTARAGRVCGSVAIRGEWRPGACVGIHR